MATVRIPDDLNDRLKAAAAKAGQSVTAYVLAACEQRLTGTAPAPPAPAARTATAKRPGARVSRARQTGPASCPHPAGRRIDGVCMACGSKPAR